MPVLKTLVETETKTRFRNLAKTRGLSESELLRSVVLVVTGQDADADQPIKPEAENSELERMTVRLPGFLMDAAKQRGKVKGHGRQPLGGRPGASQPDRQAGYDG